MRRRCAAMARRRVAAGDSWLVGLGGGRMRRRLGPVGQGSLQGTRSLTKLGKGLEKERSKLDTHPCGHSRSARPAPLAERSKVTREIPFLYERSPQA